MGTNGHTAERLGEGLAALVTQAQDGATAERLEAIEESLRRIEQALARAQPQQGAMTVLQVAERMQVHPTTVYGWIHSGELKARQFGKEYRIKQEWLDDFMEAEERQAREAVNRLRRQ